MNEEVKYEIECVIHDQIDVLVDMFEDIDFQDVVEVIKEMF